MELTQALSTAALSGVSLSSCCAFIPACFTEHVFVQVHSDCDHTKIACCMTLLLLSAQRNLCTMVQVHTVLAAKSIVGLKIEIKAVPKLIV